ncbi:MAG: hypothetical protein M0C28_11945 [Candidatus Moduliflexus flocculans]|nr:hypothetical protein [Candidatus Moduliflexus flocculans]
MEVANLIRDGKLKARKEGGKGGRSPRASLSSKWVKAKPRPAAGRAAPPPKRLRRSPGRRLPPPRRPPPAPGAAGSGRRAHPGPSGRARGGDLLDRRVFSHDLPDREGCGRVVENRRGSRVQAESGEVARVGAQLAGAGHPAARPQHGKQRLGP